MALDSSGYLYVTTSNFVSGSRRRTERLAPFGGSQSDICTGVLIYAPGAQGKANPVQGISIQDREFFGLAVDSTGNLFVSNTFSNEIYEYATPITNPTLVRTFASS